MTSKRKAELQRKLTLVAVPRPPEDLADRIKADIPKYLTMEPERARFSRSVGFNLRIAASIIVLISSLAAVLFVLAPDRAPLASAAKEEKPVVAPAEAPAEVNVDILQQAPPPAARVAPQVADAGNTAAAPSMMVRRNAQSLRDDDRAEPVSVEGGVEGRVEGGVAGGIVGGVVGGVVTEQESEFAPERKREEAIIITAEAPAVAPPPEPAPAPAPEPAPARMAKARAMPAPVSAPESLPVPPPSSPSLVNEAYADRLDLSVAPKSVFGLSIDPSVFRGIKSTIENGKRPSPAAVNVEALVNYFAGSPVRRVKRGVRLEVEASPTPAYSNGHRAILRFTIDTASIDVPERGSIPPIAKDARIEIEFNRDAVERFTPIGDNAGMPTESALLHNVSVTGLYSLDLRTPVKLKQRIATIRLLYRSVVDGRKHTIVRELHGSDIATQWARASRRHRLATLGALWGETLRGSRDGEVVAKRAEELASQAPNDTRARELAEVAVASSGGGTH